MQRTARGERNIFPQADSRSGDRIDVDAVVTVLTDACWIASTRVLCYQCLQFRNVTGLIFPAVGSTAVDAERCRHSPLSPDAAKLFWLIYVRQLSAPTSGAITHFYEDHDMRVDRRYLMNHCERCHARFSDFKLFESPEGAFQGRHPMIERRIGCRRLGGPVLATGCLVPIAPGGA
jgi:hypothetical protein